MRETLEIKVNRMDDTVSEHTRILSNAHYVDEADHDNDFEESRQENEQLEERVETLEKEVRELKDSLARILKYCESMKE